MTNSELLNVVVTKMAEKKGYAYTTGYLQSLLMSAMFNVSKKEQEAYRSDMKYTLDGLEKETV